VAATWLLARQIYKNGHRISFAKLALPEISKAELAQRRHGCGGKRCDVRQEMAADQA
jgi:hypothetical protein